MPRPRRDRAGEDQAAREVYERDRPNRPLFPARPPRDQRTTRKDEEAEWAARSGPVRVSSAD